MYSLDPSLVFAVPENDSEELDSNEIITLRNQQ